jgi:anti-anti-sigma regulatory factor
MEDRPNKETGEKAIGNGMPKVDITFTGIPMVGSLGLKILIMDVRLG